MIAIKKDVFSLVELLPKTSPFLGFGDEGERVPVLNGNYLWQEIERRQVALDIPSEYKTAFNALEWVEEKVVTREATTSQSFTKGFEVDYTPEASYVKLVPDLINWTLPVKPGTGLSKEAVFLQLVWEVQKTLPEFAEIEAQIWAEWLELATPHAYPSVEAREAQERADQLAHIAQMRAEREAYQSQQAAKKAAKPLPATPTKPILKKKK
jgi:hypothetical protein